MADDTHPADVPGSTPLTVTHFPDGTGRIGIADGWSAATLGGSCAILVRADGAQVSMGISIAALDPRGSTYQLNERVRGPGMPPPGLVVPYVADPAEAFVAINRALLMQRGRPDPDMRVVTSEPAASAPGTSTAFVTVTHRRDPVVRQVRGFVTVFPPMETGDWMLSCNLVSAPDASFEEDKPVLLAMFNSFSVERDAPGEHTAAAVGPVAAGIEQSRKDQADTVARAAADRIRARKAADTSTGNFVQGMFHSDQPT